jgi:hypothetical protein
LRTECGVLRDFPQQPDAKKRPTTSSFIAGRLFGIRRGAASGEISLS